MHVAQLKSGIPIALPSCRLEVLQSCFWICLYAKVSNQTLILLMMILIMCCLKVLQRSFWICLHPKKQLRAAQAIFDYSQNAHTACCCYKPARFEIGLHCRYTMQCMNVQVRLALQIDRTMHECEYICFKLLAFLHTSECLHGVHIV